VCLIIEEITVINILIKKAVIQRIQKHGNIYKRMILITRFEVFYSRNNLFSRRLSDDLKQNMSRFIQKMATFCQDCDMINHEGAIK